MTDPYNFFVKPDSPADWQVRTFEFNAQGVRELDLTTECFAVLQHQLIHMAVLKSYRHQPIPFPLLLKGLQTLQVYEDDQQCLDDELNEIDFPEILQVTYHSGYETNLHRNVFLETVWAHYVEIET